MMTQKEKPTFSQNLFWDIDINELDVDKYPKFVLQRVLEYGNWADWEKVKNYYSMETITQSAMSLRTLEPTALSFIVNYTNTNKKDFRCYKLAQLHPTPWNSTKAPIHHTSINEISR